MPRPQAPARKRTASKRCEEDCSEDEVTPSAAPMRMRGEHERRSKARANPWPAASAGKGRDRDSNLPPKRKRTPEVLLELSEEAGHDAAEEEELREQSWSKGYDTGSDEADSDADTEEIIEQLIPEQASEKGLSTVMKKPVEVDQQGEPFGPMKVPFGNDIKKYATDLDPRFGWEGQPKKDRRRLFRRLYTDWRIVGEYEQVSQKWMQPFITKKLIHIRWKLNKLIDGGKPKPIGMEDDVWEALKEARASDASQEKSAHMSAISKGKASTTAQHKAVEREVISRLTLLQNRAPFEAEVDAEVAKELQRLEEEKRRGRSSHGQDLQEMRSRMDELESSVSRLNDTMSTFHKSMEEMLQKILTSQCKASGGGTLDVMEPSSPIKAGNPPLLTSPRAEASKMAEKDCLLPVLQPIAPVDVVQPVPIIGQSDVKDDVVDDVNSDKQCVEDDVVEDIVANADEEQVQGADEVAILEIAEGQEGVEDVYAIVKDSRAQATSERRESMMETSTEQQEDIEVLLESSSRPRRAVRTPQVAKGTKATPKATIPKAVGLPKPAQPTKKAAVVKKSDAPRKK